MSHLITCHGDSKQDNAIHNVIVFFRIFDKEQKAKTLVPISFQLTNLQTYLSFLLEVNTYQLFSNF